MTAREALVLLAIALGLLTVAATWQWGAFGLGGSALVLLAVALLVPTRKEE